MYHIKCDSQSEMIIKKSKFITYLHRCNDESDAKEYIRQIKKEHPNANHHCYALILGEQNEIQRSNDDGEPQGTAGSPMLEILRQFQMQDILAITVRYFGGIKLGAGGLTRAYAGSVSQALQQASITKKQQMKQCIVTFSYDLIGKMDHLFRSKQMEVINKDYGEQVTYTFLCETIPSQDIAELSGGAFLPECIKEIYVDVELTAFES